MKKIILTAGTEFAISGKDIAIIDTINRTGKSILLDSKELKEAIANADPEVLALILNTDITIDGGDQDGRKKRGRKRRV